MKKLFLAAAALFGALIFSVPAHAQCTTVVTGTITDPNGLPYSNGTIQAQLVPVTTQPTCGGVTYSSFSSATLDVNGTFSMTLLDNNAGSPSGTKWQFTVTGTSGLPAPVGKGGQSFSTSLTITGASQSLTSTLSALAPALTVALSGGGGGCTPAGSNGDLQMKNGTACAASHINDTGSLLTLSENVSPTAQRNLFLAPVPTTDAVVYLANAGSGSNNGASYGAGFSTLAQAEASLVTAGGGTIHVPKGTFTGSVTFTVPTVLVCDGGASTKLTIANAANTPVVTISASNSSVSGGCTIDGNRANQSSAAATGISITSGLSGVSVTGNTITNTYGLAVSVPNGSSYLTVTGNTFSNNAQGAANVGAVDYQEPNNGTDIFVNISGNAFDESVSLAGCINVFATYTSGAPSTLLDGLKILDNTCLYGSTASFQLNGIRVATTTGTGSVGISSASIQRNQVFGNIASAGILDSGIVTSGVLLDSSISNNSIVTSRVRCIQFAGGPFSTGTNVSGNNCSDSGALEVSGSSSGATQSNTNVIGNVVADSQDATAAILVDASGGGIIHQVNVIGNTIQQSTASFLAQVGILFNGSVYDSQIVGNNIDNLSGASQTGAAIQLATSNNDIIASNHITGYTGTGNGAIGVLIGAGSTGNLLGVNNFNSVTTFYSDAGTSTIVDDVKPTNKGTSGQICAIATTFSCTWQAQSGGFANPMTTLGDLIYGGAAGAATRLAGPTGPNGVPQALVNIPSGGAAVAETWQLPGVVTRAVTGTTATDTIVSTDCNPGRVSYTGSVSVAVTLPTATTLGVANCVFRTANNTTGSSTTLTVTPTTWTVRGNANVTINQGQVATFYVDPAGSNWQVDVGEEALTAGSNITFTRGQYGLTIASTASGGVTNIATTSPITGGPITTTGTIACATCATTVSGGAISFDKSNTGLINPTADATFTYLNTSVTGLSLAGTAPASSAGATGTNASSIFNVTAPIGGGDSNATGTAGIGGSPSMTAGAGGAGTGTNTVGGAGGSLSYTAGAGGASAGTGANSNGGNISFTMGAPGTGGSGTAGKSGVASFSDGTHAGGYYITQGTAPTAANVNIPANSAFHYGPTSITGNPAFQDCTATPTNNNSTCLYSNAAPSIGAFAKMPQTAITSGTAYTNATTTFSNVVGGSGQTLQFSVEANTNYVMSCQILWSASSATSGPKFQFTGPASPTAVQYAVMQAVTATTDGTSGATAFSTSLNASGATVVTATNEPAELSLGLVNGANAGTVTLQAAAQGSGTLTIQPGSYCQLQ